MQLELFEYAICVIYPDCPNPQSDDELLLHLQYKYLTNNDTLAYAELWQRCLVIAAKIIHKEMKQNKLSFDSSYYEDLKIDAVEYVLRRYKTTPGYYIKDKFVTAIYYGVKHAMYYRNANQIIWDNALKILNSHKTYSLFDALSESKKRYEKKIGKKLNKKDNRKNQLILFEEEEIIKCLRGE